jgi:hypothetical protein
MSHSLGNERQEMRRLILAITVTAALALSVAAPAAAAPDNNPWAFEVTVTCGNDVAHNLTTGRVGFMDDGLPGAIGIAFGGTWHLYNTADDELLLTVEAPPPPGLLALGRLEVCKSHVDWGDTYTEWDPLYVMRTPNSPN